MCEFIIKKPKILLKVTFEELKCDFSLTPKKIHLLVRIICVEWLSLLTAAALRVFYPASHTAAGSVPASHGPAGRLEELQSADCDATKSGADPLGLVQPEGEPAAAKNQTRLHPRAGHRGLRLASGCYRCQEQVTQLEVRKSQRGKNKTAIYTNGQNILHFHYEAQCQTVGSNQMVDRCWVGR